MIDLVISLFGDVLNDFKFLAVFIASVVAMLFFSLCLQLLSYIFKTLGGFR